SMHYKSRFLEFVSSATPSLAFFLFFPCTSPLRSDVQGYGEIGVLSDTRCLFSVSGWILLLVFGVLADTISLFSVSWRHTLPVFDVR
ncbi:hypothetical protein, partial [uncultured Duncaniella sp.]